VQAALVKKQRQAELLVKLTPAVERFRVRLRDAVSQGDVKAKDRLELFRRNLTAFVRAYDFLSQIVDYGNNTSLEKRGIFFRHLAPLLDIPDPVEPIDLSRGDADPLQHQGPWATPASACRRRTATSRSSTR